MLTVALLMLLIEVIGLLIGVWFKFYESRKQINQFYGSIRFFNLIWDQAALYFAFEVLKIRGVLSL